jgi:TPR repeat protein
MGNADAMAFIILEPGGYGLSEEDLRETSAANALKWLNRSADAGNPYAMKALSHAYAHGYFFTREGRLEIEKDFRKSAAIAEVLQRHGDQRTATQMNDLLGYLKSKINPDDQKHVKKLAAIYEMNLARHDAFDMSSPYGIFFPENPCQD